MRMPTTLIPLSAALAAACATAPASTPSRSLLLDPTHPEWTRPAPPVSHLRFETSKGPFVLELVRAWGPRGADRFYNLVRLGFYDDTRFHRVNEGYIAQFGLSGDPAVTAAWRGHEVP
ncbi:MAG: peptidylprolyl isomerase, partial [Gemmatimonadota bacterium]